MRPLRTLAYLLLVSALLRSADAPAGCAVVGGKKYGDCSNVTIHTKSKGHLEVRNSVYESGIISGATVYKGGRLSLSGVSRGDVTVKRGGALSVSGKVEGTIRNEGGTIQIGGLASGIESKGGTIHVQGMVSYIFGSATVTYEAGAVVGGIPTPKTKTVRMKN